MTIVNPNTLFAFWNQDCTSQTDFINRLKQYMKDSLNFAQESVSDIVRLNQPTEPTQFQWEQAWLSQTGKTLPIHSNAVLLWYDTSLNSFGGQYGTINGLSTVYKREQFYPKGAIVYQDSDWLTSSIVDFRGNMQSSRSIMPSLTFSVRQEVDLWLDFQVYIQNTTGSSRTIGVDFEINGDKVGTTYYGVSEIQALYATTTSNVSQFLHCSIPVLNVPAGTYTVQPIIGHALATGFSEFDMGGAANGARILTVRAIAT